MRIVVDRAKCISNGMCAALAPEYFEISDDGELVVLSETAPEEAEPQLRDAEAACPTGAIEIHDN